MTIAKIIPMAFVMIAGPQILSSIFLATSEQWRRNSAAYVSGAALAITATVTAAYFLSSGAAGKGSSDDAVYIVIMALLVIAAIHTFATRKTAKPPKWMGKLESETPRTSFRLGFLLLGLFPGDIVTSVAVGAYLSNQGDPWWHMLPFLALTLLFLGLPALAVLALAAVKSCGKKAQGLPEAAGAALQAACTTVGDNANQALSKGGAQVDQALSQAAGSCKSAVKQLPAGEAQAALTNPCAAISSS